MTFDAAARGSEAEVIGETTASASLLLIGFVTSAAGAGKFG